MADAEQTESNTSVNKEQFDKESSCKTSIELTDKMKKTDTKSESEKSHDNEYGPSDNADTGQDNERELSDNGLKEGLNDKQSLHDYEVIDGKYYYTDAQSGQKYVYNESTGQWDTSDDGHQEVSTDEEGRTYYRSQGMYLCRDAHGNVFYLDEKNEWIPWGTSSESTTAGEKQEESSKWYFHQGDNMFYRDKVSNVVYRLNKDINEWEVYEGKVKVKRPRIDAEEEFDTDEDSDEEDDFKGSAPPGARNDPSIEYDGVTYTKRDPGDNMVYEWDSTRRAWFPKLDEDFMASYQLSYGFNPDGTKNENPLKFDDDDDEPEEETKVVEKQETGKGSQPKSKPTWFKMDDAISTKVYVSNLPASTTEEEFLELMQKCGMILKDPDNNKYKIKMYRDSEGNFKGDALCSYIKRESVDLALQILDGYQTGNQKIRVELAKFEMKGDYNPKLKPRKKAKKVLEKIQRKQEKLFDWRPEPLRGQRQKHEKTVIIRNVFNPKEFEDSMERILTHKEAIRNQCSNFGEVTKFDLHDLHEEGVVQVTFAEVEAADMCVATLNNRLYCSRNLKVSTWDGKEKFRIEETDAQREERLKNWDKFLEDGSQTKK